MPSRCSLLNASLLITIGLFFALRQGTPTHITWGFGTSSLSSILTPEQPCQTPPLLDDVLVVMKTGFTEALSRMPIHFATTLRCVPHHIIFSDFQEEIEGNVLHDALTDVGIRFKESESEFSFYADIQRNGRDALSKYETTQFHKIENTAHGKDNLAWILDKWKFLPIADRAYAHRPQSKWFVFLEADSYLVWENFMQWLEHFDPTEPHYLGYQMQIGTTLFAYGGARYAISNAAMGKAVDYRHDHFAELEEYTAGAWAGDEVLGHVLERAGVDLFWAYPTVQPDASTEFDYAEQRYNHRIWCHAVVGWHHLSPSGLRNIAAFVKNWDWKSIMLHSDVFKYYILPNIEERPERSNWDNLSQDEVTVEDGSDFASLPDGISACRSFCLARSECKQYSWREQKCFTSTIPRLGHDGHDEMADAASLDAHSGWIVDRIRDYVAQMQSCGNDGPWVLPEEMNNE